MLTESGGFFDGQDKPPWSTWVGYEYRDDDDSEHAGWLIAWVPPELIDSVDHALDHNACGNACWYDEL